MKAKKSQIAFMLVGLLVVGGVSFLLGRQSAPPTAVPPTESTAPAESNGVDIKTESIDTVEEFLKGDELTALFQQVYDLVIEQEIPQEYRLQTELLYLPDLNATGKALPADYEAQYLDWRPVDEVSEQELTTAITPEPAPEPTPEPTPTPVPTQTQTSAPSDSQSQQNTNTNTSGGQENSDGFNSGYDLTDADGNGIPDIMEPADPLPYDDEHREEWGHWRGKTWIWNTESLIDPESPNYDPRTNPESPNYTPTADPRQEPLSDPGEGYRWKWYWNDDYSGGIWGAYKPDYGSITIK